MAVIPVAEWIPDAAVLGNPGSIVITNALPGTTGYKPMKSFAAITTALGARPRGGITVRDDANNTYNYVGDVDTLYVQNGTGWTDVSLSGGYTTADDESWEFVEWKDQVLATNFSDNPQSIAMGTANFADLTTAFKARHIAVVREFIVFGNTTEAGDGAVPYRLRWSAFNDETDYTVSPTTGADVRDLVAGGWIQGVIGGETGMIISEETTHRMSFVGTPVWFQLDEVTPGIGTYSPGSIASLGGTSWFWSEHGICQLSNYGTGVDWPASGRVDNFIRDDLDYNNRHRITSVVDPLGSRVMWAYPGTGNTGGTPNRILVYDWTLSKFSLINETVEMLIRGAAVGYTLEGLDAISTNIDTLPASLDSPLWQGGSPNLAAINDSFLLGFFTGPQLPATIETRETEILEGQRAQLNAFRPLVDGGTVTAQVGTRNRQSDEITFGSVLAQNATTGQFTNRSNARFHTFRLNITGDDWTDAIGVAVDKQDIKAAGVR